MLVLYQAIPLMPHKGLHLEGKGMTLSTMDPDSDQLVDKTQRIVRHLCPQAAKYTQFSQSGMRKLYDLYLASRVVHTSNVITYIVEGIACYI